MCLHFLHLVIEMKYFKKQEFFCKCGCGLNIENIDQTLIYQLNLARKFAGVPFVINSSIRCIKHNRRVGGSPTSSHLKGFAVDIRTKNKYVKKRVLFGLKQAGFCRIGIYKTFIHADNDPDKPCAQWKGK